jgi:hypothetical protein
MCLEDLEANERALLAGDERLFSAYDLDGGWRL